MYWTRFKLWFDRTISNNGPRQWAIPALSFCISIVIFALTLLLVNNGWCLMENSAFKATDSYAPKNVLDAAFYHMFTNGGQNLYHSHFWGAIITIVGLIVIAILTSSITNFFEQRAKQYLSGETNYYFKDHIVILGANDILYSIIQTFKNDPDNCYILVLSSKDVEKIRREVFSFLDLEYDKNRIVFYYGDRTSLSDISRLHLDKAKEVFIIGEAQENDIEESYRDSYNIECVNRIKDALAAKSPAVERDVKEWEQSVKQIEKDSNELDGILQEICPKIGRNIDNVKKNLKEFINNLKPSNDISDDKVKCLKCLYDSICKSDSRKESLESTLAKHKKLRCNVMFEYQTTFAAFHNCDVDYPTKVYINFEPFSFHEMWAQKVLLEGKCFNQSNPIEYHFLDELPGEKSISYINETSKQCVHLIIFGMSKMGVALALEAAHICHFPNYTNNHEQRTRITFIDENADIEEEFFAGRFKELKKNSVWRVANANSCATSLYQSSILIKKNQPQWLDIEWEFIKGRIEQKKIQEFLIESSKDTKFIQTVAICYPQSHIAMAAALYLPEIVYDKSLQILVYQRLSGEMVSLVSKEKKLNKYSKLIPFGMISEGYSSSMTDNIGPILVNSAYGTKLLTLVEELQCDSKKFKEYLEEFSSSIEGMFYKMIYLFKSEEYKRFVYGRFKMSKILELNQNWYKEPVSNRWSSRFNFNSIIPKLRSFKYFLNDSKPALHGLEELIASKTDSLIIVEHNRWNIEKLLSGFRPLDEDELKSLNSINYKKDSKTWEAAKKEFQKGRHKAHADLCDYDELLKRDPNALNFDLALNQQIPTIIKMKDVLRQ